jgi:hypothetical protein
MAGSIKTDHVALLTTEYLGRQAVTGTKAVANKYVSNKYFPFQNFKTMIIFMC